VSNIKLEGLKSPNLNSDDIRYILHRYNVMYWNVYGVDIMRSMKNEEIKSINPKYVQR
jgi:hypothetical protein